MRKQALSMIARNWPFANGSGRVIDRLGRGINLGQGQVECVTSDGFTMDVLAEDHIGRHIILSGSFDRAGVAALLHFAAPGDICVDIGANIGYVACVLLARIQQARVYCVEPQPLIVDLLRRNLSRFPAERWEVLEAGLSAEMGSGYLALGTGNSGSSTLAAEGSDVTVPIRLVSASRYFAGFERLDLVKMDIEGHEEVVLAAGATELDRLQPKAILYEDNQRLSGPDEPIGKTLAAIGYAVFGLDKRLTRTSLTLVTGENAKNFHDFVAVSRRRTFPASAMRALNFQLH